VDSDKVGQAQLKPAKKKRPALKAAIVVSAIIIVALLLLTPAAQGFLRDLVSSPFRERYPASATFTLDRSMLINANGGEAGGGDSALGGGDQAGDGRGFSGLLDVYSKKFLQAVEVHASRNAEGVLALGNHVRGVMLVADLADDFLDHVFHGDQAGN
jgi:hypothetical protein